MKKFPYRCSECQEVFYGGRQLEDNPCCEGKPFQRLAVIHWLKETKERGRGVLKANLLASAVGSDSKHLPPTASRSFKRGCLAKGGPCTTAKGLATCYDCLRSVDILTFDGHKFVLKDEDDPSNPDETEHEEPSPPH